MGGKKDAWTAPLWLAMFVRLTSKRKSDVMTGKLKLERDFITTNCGS